MTQISGIGSAEDAALWAYCNMRAKNGLSATDARQVEEAFEGKLSGLRSPTESGSGRDVNFAVHTAGEPAGDASEASTADVRSVEVSRPTAPAPKATRRRARRAKAIDAIDKTVLTFPEPRRVREREHVRFVAKQACLVCSRQPSDAHHLRFAQGRALGRKVSDEFTVPLCRGHHREIHRCGDEAQWWGTLGIDPTGAARALWLEIHPLLR